MILLLDNYDSFTYNLYQYICELNKDVLVLRNNETSLDKIDPTCGLHIRKKLSQKVEVNEPIIEIFGSNKSKIEIAKKMLDKTILISDKEIKKESKIFYE